MSDDIARFFTARVWLWACACVGRYQYSRGRGCSTKQLSMRELPIYARGSPALRQQLGRFLPTPNNPPVNGMSNLHWSAVFSVIGCGQGFFIRCKK